MPLLCYDLRHLSLITMLSLHAFCKTTGHKVKVQEHLQILQPEGPASPTWLRAGASFRDLVEGGKIPLSENRETFMTSGQPRQEEFGPSRKAKIVKHCPDFPPHLKKQMFRSMLKSEQFNISWESRIQISPKMGILFVDFKTFRIPSTTQGTDANIVAQCISSSSPLIGQAFLER